MEETGRIRRGYFVAGLGATQFALPGALDLLRSLRDATGRCPRSRCSRRPIRRIPYGATLKWPAYATGGASARQSHELSARFGAAARELLSARRGTRADAIGRRHGDSRQRRAGGVSGARRSAARHVPARAEPERSKAGRAVARVLIERARTRRRGAARHADRGDRRRRRQRRIRWRRCWPKPDSSAARWDCRRNSTTQVISRLSSVISRKSPVLSQESSIVSRSRPSPVPSRDDISKIRTSRLTDDCGLTTAD